MRQTEAFVEQQIRSSAASMEQGIKSQEAFAKQMRRSMRRAWRICREMLFKARKRRDWR